MPVVTRLNRPNFSALCSVSLALCLVGGSAFGVELGDKDSGNHLHVLLYGDAGDGGAGQLSVASGMATIHHQTKFDMAVSVGDNLYNAWAEGVFKRAFETPYAPLIQDGVRFYQAVGNHDMEDVRLAKELQYSRDVDAEARNIGGWVMPAEDYIVDRANARFIFLNIAAADNSVNWPATRAAWAQEKICAPFTGWKFLVIHYPLWSTNAHNDNPELQQKLLPILQSCPVDMVFQGHDHFAEYIHPWNWIPFLIVGNGHEVRQDVRPSARESLFSLREIGFASLMIEGDKALISFRDETGKVRYQFSWQRRVPAWADTWMQSGNQVLARVTWDPGLRSQLEVEIGFSDTAADPVWEPERFTFVPAQYQGPGNGPNLLAHGAQIPAGFNSGYAVARFRSRGSVEWTYADRADGPGLHGNYDGIQIPNLLTFRKLEF